MKSAIWVTPYFLAILVLGSDATEVRAQQTVIDTPGVHISNGTGGTSIVVPGASINVPASAPTVPMQQGVVSNVAASSYANARLPGMDFSHKNLAAADFSNATLTGANFAGSDLTATHFNNADLTEVDFTNARLTGADLSNVNLAGANLSNADFSNANLTNASLDHALASGTRFDGAILTNVDMGQLVRQVPAQTLVRPAFVDAQAISNALQATQRKIDLTINFDFNSDKLTADGVKQIGQVATALKNPVLANARIMIEGHTDNVGSDTYNQDLSYRRALCVLRILVDQYGIDAARLSAQGFGKTRPVASNDNDLGRAMNRRVTLVNLGV